jgi:4-diphosphocytidyl-2-C-methyl-D-erythritol kinase
MTTRRFRSFAKINLGLEVVGMLPNGYHELRTLFAAISLHDTVDIALTKSGISVQSDHASVPGDETNLAHRAAAAMQRRAGGKAGVAIRIRKRIAVGGGLGGGSSNAATVLRALDLMWGLGLGPEGLVETAKSLGADVPYFLFGGPALGLGRGDLIRPLDLRLKQKILLVPGQGGISTAAVFRRFAADGGVSGAASRIVSFLEAERAGRPKPLGALRNDLERAAIEESPSLAAIAKSIRRTGRSTGAVHAAMSGSGSSFFLLFDDAEARNAALAKLDAVGIRGLRCSFVSKHGYERRFEIRSPRPV